MHDKSVRILDSGQVSQQKLGIFTEKADDIKEKLRIKGQNKSFLRLVKQTNQMLPYIVKSTS